MGGAGSPREPGGDAEIRRLRRRVIELEETNRALHERNQVAMADAASVPVLQDQLSAANASLRDCRNTLETCREECDRLRVGGKSAAQEGARLSRENDELRAQVATLARERDEARRVKGGKR